MHIRWPVLLLLALAMSGCVDGVAEDPDAGAGPAEQELRLYANTEGRGAQVQHVLSVQKNDTTSVGVALLCVDDGVASGCAAGPFHWVNGSASIPRDSEVVVEWQLTSLNPGPLAVRATLTADGVPVAQNEVRVFYAGAFLPLITVTPVDIPLQLSRSLEPSDHLALLIQYEGTLGATYDSGGEWASWIRFSNATVHHPGDV